MEARLIEFIHAPNHPATTAPVIFLAGPIQGTDDWQARAVEHLRAYASREIQALDFVIASPRRPTIDGMGDFDRDTFVEQLEWEHHYLREAERSGVTLFWCANQTRPIENRAYAQTTRFELAEAMTVHRYERSRVVVGIDDRFTGRTYLRYTLEKKAPKIPLLDTLAATCERAIALLSDLRDSKVLAAQSVAPVVRRKRFVCGDDVLDDTAYFEACKGLPGPSPEVVSEINRAIASHAKPFGAAALGYPKYGVAVETPPEGFMPLLPQYVFKEEAPPEYVEGMALYEKNAQLVWKDWPVAEREHFAALCEACHKHNVKLGMYPRKRMRSEGE